MNIDILSTKPNNHLCSHKSLLKKGKNKRIQNMGIKPLIKVILHQI